MEKVYGLGLLFLLSGVAPFNPNVEELSAPKLIEYPSPVTHFSNSVGLTLTCQTAPNRWLSSVVEWWMESESSGHYLPLQSIPGVRESMDNGSLHFLPFSSDHLISSVHQGRYRCSARNPIGSYLSPVFQVKAVIDEPFQVSIKSPQTSWIEGNPAVLECSVTAQQLSPFARIIAWKQIDQFGHEREITSGDDPNYVLTLPHGHLLILQAPLQRLFVCVAQHTLNHQVKSSTPFLFKSAPNTKPLPLSLVQPQLSPRSILADGHLDLVCLTLSNPLPIWRWERLRTGKWTPIVGDQVVGPLLRLNKDFPINGTYRCEATNPSGVVSLEYSVKSQENLNVSMEPRRVVAYPGHNVEFSCTLSPSQTAGDFVFYRNGKPLLASSRVTMSRSLLKIINVRPEDQGVYQCFGDTSSVASAELIFPVSPPELVHTFISQSVTPGPSISLKCSALGNPAPVIAWFIDDLMVSRSPGESRLPPQRKYLWEGQTQETRFHLGESRSASYSREVVSFLNISSVRVEDSGLYKCTASNIVSSVSHSARLNVYGGIFVRESLGRSVTYAHGDSVYIPCHYGGYPVDKIIWQKDSKNLVSHENPARNPGDPRFSLFANGTLKISDISADGSSSDKGRYTCVISNRKGEVASGSVSVNVLHPPQISSFKFEKVLVEGQRTSVLCNVISGDLPINISWLKDSQVISSNLNVTENRVRFLSVLAFDDLREEHSGEYTCVAENPARVVKQSATLLVRVPPKWVKVGESIKAVMGTEIFLDCVARGVPSPNITWFRDFATGKIQIQNSSKFGLISSGESLQIRNIQESDRGVYICQAENGVGGSPILHQTKLDVIIPAKISGTGKAGSGSVVIGEGAVALLTCQIQGDGPIQVTWKKDSAVVLLDSASQIQRILEKVIQVNSSMIRAELKIDSSGLADSGIYECVASNQYGRDEKQIQLEVKARPLAPEDFMVEEIGSRFIRLKWSTSYPKLSSSDPITQFRLAWRKLDESTKQPSAGYNLTLTGSQNWALIENLEPITNYRIWIFSSNKIGESLSSQPLLVLTLAEAPSGPPLNLSAIPLSPKSVLVEWKPPEISKQHGTILGYYVTAIQQVHQGSALPQNVTVDIKFQEESKLENLQPNSQYRICVSAYNSAGNGPLSPFLFIQTPEGAPDAAPRDIHCEPLSPKSVQVSWEPPPEEKQNGQILGYKVSYISLEGEQAGEKPEVKKTSNKETTLHGLKSWTKYAVKVLAYTVGGESAHSELVECITEEDVPSQVTDIKVICTGTSSVVVSWLPPVVRNGKITKFIVFWTAEEDPGVNEKTVKAGESEEFVAEVGRLKENTQYVFWIAAFTSAGQGKVSKKESVYTSGTVLPRISSFSVVKSVIPGESVKLPCRSFVTGDKHISWFKDDTPVDISNKRKLDRDGSLVLARVKDEDEGGYKCRVENDHGSEEIQHKVVISRPPGIVNLAVGYITHSSIQVHWETPKITSPELIGYLLEWKLAGKQDWSTVKVSRLYQSHIFEDIRCGTQYQFRIAGINTVGRGQFSDILTVRTFGGPPDDKPRLTEILDGNGTMIRIDLSRWPDNGCPLSKVFVEYRKLNGSSWSSLGSRLNGSRVWTLQTELNQRYEFQVKVVNDAGQAMRRFMIESHPDFFKNYAKVSERVESGERSNENSNIVPFYSDPHVIVPIASGIICTLAAAVCFLMIFAKRRNLRRIERERAQASSEWKFSGGVPRHNSQQSWLSSSAGCQDKCSPGDFTDPGGITETTSIYATLNSTKPIQMTIRDSTVRLRSFEDFDNYDAPPIMSPLDDSHYHQMPPGFTGPSKKKRRKGSQNSMDSSMQQAISCQVEFPPRIEPPHEFRNEIHHSSTSSGHFVSGPGSYQQHNGDVLSSPTGVSELYHDYSYPYHQFPSGGIKTSSSGEILHPRLVTASSCSNTLKKSARKHNEKDDPVVSTKRVSRDTNEYY